MFFHVFTKCFEERWCSAVFWNFWPWMALKITFLKSLFEKLHFDVYFWEVFKLDLRRPELICDQQFLAENYNYRKNGWLFLRIFIHKMFLRTLVFRKALFGNFRHSVTLNDLEFRDLEFNILHFTFYIKSFILTYHLSGFDKFLISFDKLNLKILDRFSIAIRPGNLR